MSFNRKHRQNSDDLPSMSALNHQQRELALKEYAQRWIGMEYEVAKQEALVQKVELSDKVRDGKENLRRGLYKHLRVNVAVVDNKITEILSVG